MGTLSRVCLQAALASALSLLLFVHPAGATVKAHQKISDTEGNFTAPLGNNDRFGIGIAPLGDLDGNGVVDIAVGAYWDDFSDTFRGAVYILFLNADGTVKEHTKITSGEGGFTGELDYWDEFGVSIATIGDLDDDGVVDIAVGARLDDDAATGRDEGQDNGAVWILFLNTNGTVKAYQKISAYEGGVAGLDSGDWFGSFVTPLGDFDGDGVEDLAVATPNDDDGGVDRGAIRILHLNPNGSVKSHQKISDTQGGFGGGLDDGDFFGAGIASLGDLDGDGVLDLAVGATQDDDGGSNRGAVWILFLSTDGTVKSHRKISATQGGFTGTLDNNDRFGASPALLGVGCNDRRILAVGATLDDDGGTDRGAAWLVELNSDGTVYAHSKISSTSGGFTGSLGNNDYFGLGIAGLGDFDGDGAADLAVGARADDDGGTDRGAVWLLFLDECTIEPPADLRPNIVSILDVGNDQGRKVRVRFKRSGRDVLDSPTPIIQYEIFRRIDELPSGAGQPRAPRAVERPAGMISETGVLLDDWDYVGALPAHGESIYNVLAATLADSTERSGMHWSVFFVRAATSAPLVFFDSPVDSGYSIDNLSPGQPGGLTAAYGPGGVALAWTAPVDPDVCEYYVYRDTNPLFDPSSSTLLTITPYTNWFDAVAQSSQYHYRVSAVDFAGNEGPPAAPTVTTGVGSQVPSHSSLHQNVPNPFNPSTTIGYDIAAPGGRVVLGVFDVRGRLIRTLVDARQAPGSRSVRWDGRDDAGRPVVSGVYFCKLQVDGNTFTRKMTVVQ